MANHPHTHHETESHTYGPDTKAAFTGLVVGLIALFILMYGIVKFTNSYYAGKTPHAATK